MCWMAQRRFQVLDSWRGIGAVLVALHHLLVAGHIQETALVRNAWLFVDFFFVLSGFVLAHAYGARIGCARSALAFMVRRAGRPWPHHLAVLGCFVGLELVKLCLSGLGVTFGQEPFTGSYSLAALTGNALLLHSLGLHDGLT
jgi:peptidoglycan/LPS O-acetylase OafA/YrhL